MKCKQLYYKAERIWVHTGTAEAITTGNLFLYIDLAH